MSELDSKEVNPEEEKKNSKSLRLKQLEYTQKILKVKITDLEERLNSILASEELNDIPSKELQSYISTHRQNEFLRQKQIQIMKKIQAIRDTTKSASYDKKEKSESQKKQIKSTPKANKPLVINLNKNPKKPISKNERENNFIKGLDARQLENYMNRKQTNRSISLAEIKDHERRMKALKQDIAYRTKIDVYVKEGSQENIDKIRRLRERGEFNIRSNSGKSSGSELASRKAILDKQFNNRSSRLNYSRIVNKMKLPKISSSKRDQMKQIINKSVSPPSMEEIKADRLFANRRKYVFTSPFDSKPKTKQTNKSRKASPAQKPSELVKSTKVNYLKQMREERRSKPRNNRSKWSNILDSKRGNAVENVGVLRNEVEYLDGKARMMLQMVNQKGVQNSELIKDTGETIISTLQAKLALLDRIQDINKGV